MLMFEMEVHLAAFVIIPFISGMTSCQYYSVYVGAGTAEAARAPGASHSAHEQFSIIGKLQIIMCCGGCKRSSSKCKESHPSVHCFCLYHAAAGCCCQMPMMPLHKYTKGSRRGRRGDLELRSFVMCFCRIGNGIYLRYEHCDHKVVMMERVYFRRCWPLFEIENGRFYNNALAFFFFFCCSILSHSSAINKINYIFG